MRLAMVDYSKVGMTTAGPPRDAVRAGRDGGRPVAPAARAPAVAGARSRSAALFARACERARSRTHARAHAPARRPTQWNDKDLDALLNDSDDEQPAPARYADVRAPRRPSPCQRILTAALVQLGALDRDAQRR